MEAPTALPSTMPDLDLDKLQTIRVLGKGAMGTVFLVSDPASPRSLFALKVVDKSSFQTKYEADSRAMWEIAVLSRLHHPFLPTLLATVDTADFLAWAVPYCSGGDLNVLRHRQTDRVFSPAVIRFYAAEILCALHHLHQMGIVYRDLKPENILIQQSGHVCLTDFDLSRQLSRRTTTTQASSSPESPVLEARPRHRRNLTRIMFALSDAGGDLLLQLKKVKSARVSPVSRRKPSFSTVERSNSFVGTEEYVAPEVVRGDGHEFAVDWWAFGILMYEMMYGRTPFRGNNRKETFRNVLTKTPEFLGKRTALIDLIERLLEKDPEKRLGYGVGAAEIRQHDFFRGLRWDMLMEVSRPPFLAPAEGERELTEKVTARGRVCILEYFQAKKCASVPGSPSLSTLRSQSSVCGREEEEARLTEF
ncbi:hypothetical protein Scep_004331 [Stephania cephalantha]|uniref:non-specific serine/threonine protein kinase n=1 Tax=Stephania cephalantha TaxID=152367 RepID=A0AAP0KU32_9MAGN